MRMLQKPDESGVVDGASSETNIALALGVSFGIVFGILFLLVLYIYCLSRSVANDAKRSRARNIFESIYTSFSRLDSRFDSVVDSQREVTQESESKANSDSASKRNSKENTNSSKTLVPKLNRKDRNVLRARRTRFFRVASSDIKTEMSLSAYGLLEPTLEYREQQTQESSITGSQGVSEEGVKDERPVPPPKFLRNPSRFFFPQRSNQTGRKKGVSKLRDALRM